MGCNISGKVVLISVIELGSVGQEAGVTRELQSTLHPGHLGGIFLVSWKGLINFFSNRPFPAKCRARRRFKTTPSEKFKEVKCVFSAALCDRFLPLKRKKGCSLKYRAIVEGSLSRLRLP